MRISLLAFIFSTIKKHKSYKTAIKTPLMSYDLEFEKQVFNYLFITQGSFNDYVNTNGGVAQLLRNWIFEAFKSGKTPYEVARVIQNSPHILEHIEKIKKENNNPK
ncbi:hypothetical protein, partial [Aquimarina longa]|uniref:hypothetical protein n=1 Tax=Aquimarina longa TaxID=1080221 RepID=UPI000A75CC17